MDFLYFFAYYWSNQKEKSKDVNFIVPENNNDKPECIYSIEDPYVNKKFYYKKIFKIIKPTPKEKKKKSNKYYFEFEIGENKYIITFEDKETTFIYDVTLEVGKRIIDIQRKIPQNIIEYSEKIDIFIEALKEEGEEEKIDDLYKEAIKLYSEKKGFYFLISLFLKIYKKKDICSILLEIFRKMNEEQKQNENNMDRKSNLKNYKSKFQNIIKNEAEQLIKENKYNLIEFYGIILCYLNYYDEANFSLVIDELFTNNPEVLYEILLIYHTHFINPISQNFEFLNKFVVHSIDKKEFQIFQIGLNYIKDIETFINILEKNKDNIFKGFFKSDNTKEKEKFIVKLDKNLKFKKANNIDENKGDLTPNPEDESKKYFCNISNFDDKGKQEVNYNAPEPIKNNDLNNYSDDEQINESKNILKIIKNIESIINFSKSKNIFFVNFTVDFWKYVLNCHKKPKQDNIKICFELRNAFLNYHELVNLIFSNKAKSTIKKDANKYYEIDEFTFLLNQIINRYIKNNDDLSDIDKLRFITQYNPYYRENKYSNKVDSDIFDQFKLDNVDEYFIEDFRKQNFESVFKDNLHGYITKITSKIKTISNFDDVIKLVNIKNIKKIEDKKIFLDSLKKRYDIIKKEIETLSGKDLEKARKVIVELAILNFTYEEKKKN